MCTDRNRTNSVNHIHPQSVSNDSSFTSSASSPSPSSHFNLRYWFLNALLALRTHARTESHSYPMQFNLKRMTRYQIFNRLLHAILPTYSKSLKSTRLLLSAIRSPDKICHPHDNQNANHPQHSHSKAIALGFFPCLSFSRLSSASALFRKRLILDRQDRTS